MRLRTSAMLGAALLVAILLSASGGGSTVNTAQDGPKYFGVSSDATAIEYGLL